MKKENQIIVSNHFQQERDGYLTLFYHPKRKRCLYDAVVQFRKAEMVMVTLLYSYTGLLGLANKITF